MNSAILVLSLLGFNTQPCLDGRVAGAGGGAVGVQCKNPGIFKAVTVVKAYRDNQAYASEYFEGGQVIQISGRMLKLKKWEIDPSGKESFVLLLSPDGKPPKTVHLAFLFEDEDRCKLSQLFPGQYVTIKGQFQALVEKEGQTEVQFHKCMLAD